MTLSSNYAQDALGDVCARTLEEELVEVSELGIAFLGNGDDMPINKDQLNHIKTLHDWAITQERQIRICDPEILNSNNEDDSGDSDIECWCHPETCRRYLVARKWDLKAAKAQLLSTLEWRHSASGRNSTSMEFWESPKARKNPLSLSMRIVGWDAEGRPMIYSNFQQANDRWDVNANMLHLNLLLEACCKILEKRQTHGLNKTASSRQWIWVLDFDGFGMRDQNPMTAMSTAKLLDRYPELMHRVILLNAPFLFSATWRMLTPLLDNRVREKVVFLSYDDMLEDTTLRQRLGNEALDWILGEVQDNIEKRENIPPKQYWAHPTSPCEHDSRGMKSYVDSDLYVKTPGDAWQEGLEYEKQNKL